MPSRRDSGHSKKKSARDNILKAVVVDAHVRNAAAGYVTPQSALATEAAPLDPRCDILTSG